MIEENELAGDGRKHVRASAAISDRAIHFTAVAVFPSRKLHVHLIQIHALWNIVNKTSVK